MSVRIITTQQFNSDVAASEKPVLVNFFATWCMPCKHFAVVLDEVADTVKDKNEVVKLDIDENMDLARKYGVMSIPTSIVMKDGVEVDRIIGYKQPNEVLEVLNKHNN